MTLETTELTVVIKPLAALVEDASVQRYKKSIRIYRPEHTMGELSPGVVGAMRDLVLAGMTVRLYEGSFISTGMIIDGIFTWTHRMTSKHRPLIVIEVSQ